ncbi:MAG: hypothetical protein ABH986_01205 [archaeon]
MGEGTGISGGIKVFFVLFTVLFALNLIGIKLFSGIIYSAEGITGLFLISVLNQLFMRL